MLKAVILVACGGALGSVVRYLVGIALASSMGFPWTTLLVNVLGSLLIGLAFGYGQAVGGQASAFLLLVGMGFCGGFTTFSTFSLEGLKLLQAGLPLLYALYVVASVGLGLFAVWFGYRMAI